MRFLFAALLTLISNSAQARLDSFAHKGKIIGFNEKKISLLYKGSKIKIDRAQVGTRTRLKVGKMITWAPGRLE